MDAMPGVEYWTLPRSGYLLAHLAGITRFYPERVIHPCEPFAINSSFRADPAELPK
jgi:hypothetical protein